MEFSDKQKKIIKVSGISLLGISASYGIYYVWKTFIKGSTGGGSENKPPLPQVDGNGTTTKITCKDYFKSYFTEGERSQADAKFKGVPKDKIKEYQKWVNNVFYRVLRENKDKINLKIPIPDNLVEDGVAGDCTYVSIILYNYVAAALRASGLSTIPPKLA